MPVCAACLVSSHNTMLTTEHSADGTALVLSSEHYVDCRPLENGSLPNYMFDEVSYATSIDGLDQCAQSM